MRTHVLWLGAATLSAITLAAGCKSNSTDTGSGPVSTTPTTNPTTTPTTNPTTTPTTNPTSRDGGPDPRVDGGVTVVPPTTPPPATEVPLAPFICFGQGSSFDLTKMAVVDAPGSFGLEWQALFNPAQPVTPPDPEGAGPVLMPAGLAMQLKGLADGPQLSAYVGPTVFDPRNDLAVKFSVFGVAGPFTLTPVSVRTLSAGFAMASTAAAFNAQIDVVDSVRGGTVTETVPFSSVSFEFAAAPDCSSMSGTMTAYLTPSDADKMNFFGMPIRTLGEVLGPTPNGPNGSYKVVFSGGAFPLPVAEMP